MKKRVRSRLERFLFAAFKVDEKFCIWVFLCEKQDGDIIFPYFLNFYFLISHPCLKLILMSVFKQLCCYGAFKPIDNFVAVLRLGFETSGTWWYVSDYVDFFSTLLGIVQFSD
jgi:hypothetical protein